VGRREHKLRFWEAIARGLSSEAAGITAGVSAAVGVRWFRESGGMAPITHAPLSGRYLSFAEREEIALLQARDCGVRDIARQLGRSHQRSRESCAATRRPAAAVWSIGPRPRSGTPTGGPGVPRQPSSPPTMR
jgi:Helix-turn-helix domain